MVPVRLGGIGDDASFDEGRRRDRKNGGGRRRRRAGRDDRVRRPRAAVRLLRRVPRKARVRREVLRRGPGERRPVDHVGRDPVIVRRGGVDRSPEIEVDRVRTDGGQEGGGVRVHRLDVDRGIEDVIGGKDRARRGARRRVVRCDPGSVQRRRRPPISHFRSRRRTAGYEKRRGRTDHESKRRWHRPSIVGAPIGADGTPQSITLAATRALRPAEWGPPDA